MKEVLIVSIGSFFGGGMRYWISKLVQSCTVIAFPFGTMAVNVAGCLIIGFLSGLNWQKGDGCRHLPNCCSPRDSAEDSLPSLPL